MNTARSRASGSRSTSLSVLIGAVAMRRARDSDLPVSQSTSSVPIKTRGPINAPARAPPSLTGPGLTSLACRNGMPPNLLGDGTSRPAYQRIKDTCRSSRSPIAAPDLDRVRPQRSHEDGAVSTRLSADPRRNVHRRTTTAPYGERATLRSSGPLRDLEGNEAAVQDPGGPGQRPVCFRFTGLPRRLHQRDHCGRRWCVRHPHRAG